MKVASKIKLTREVLLQPLQQVIGVVERKQTLPILSHVLLNFSNSQLSITGTDLEVELVGHVALEQPLAEPLAITVPGRKLLDICRALPENAPLELMIEENKVILKSERSRFTLSTLPANEFPNIEGQDQQLNFNITQHDLLSLMQQTHFAMAQQDVRYYLNGMLFEANNNLLRTVATDGHRLATNQVPIQLQLEHRLQIIVPRKGVLELMRLLNDSADEIKITIGNNHVQAQTKLYTFTSKLVEGRFPDYQRVIPKQGDKNLTIGRELLKQSLSRAAILCNDKFHGIRFELARNLLKIQAHNPEQESAEEELIVKYEAEAVDIGFNVNYVLDILNTLSAESVVFYFKDSNNSVLLVANDDQSKALFVIMPMRL